ncbi:MAG TPA: glycerol-3-phosphate dehydrogenase/oxidase [Candidatus Angelobacter sp.]|jgi:glycerol-3-phosphate dehydrogenase|nr:glycerol-3-phosphate dehydrogenase/oxidase [Candidatus Angelobacter sp.]
MIIPGDVSLAGQRFDVLIIGGGINGLAIARECVRAGRRILLVEQNDFSSGTTSRATRIIHGGLRYLEHGEVNLVRESLRERERLLCHSPHLVRPLQFLLVLSNQNRSLLRNSLAIRTGLWLYHQWAGKRRPPKVDLSEFERQLDAGQSWSIYSYEDAQCEFPERLIAEWLIEVLGAGAVVRNYTQVLQVESSDGQVTGARLRDRRSNVEFEVFARRVVNATGPWADFVVNASGLRRAADAKPMIGGVRGSHLVLPRFAGAPSQAIYTEAVDERPFFIIPWNGQMLVGTTEVSDTNPENPQPSSSEVDYMLDSLARLLPRSGITRADIRYTFAGIRPLPFSPGTSFAAVTRRHIIHDHQEDGAAGMISIIGGKLTTAVSLAREAAKKLGLAVPEPVPIYIAPAPANGVESSLRQWAHLVASKGNIPESSALAIAEWHGGRALAIAQAARQEQSLAMPLCPHSQHIVAEAIEAVFHERAVTLGDILLRRVPVALGACWSESCSREAANRIGSALGWNESHIAKELESFEEEREGFLHPKRAGMGVA